MDIIDQRSQGDMFALVCYVPRPLGPKLDDLKRSLGGDPPSPPHITLLPPRPLLGTLSDAYERIKDVLVSFPAFELELTDVCRFPATNVLYLAVGKGSQQIHEIYRALNHGEFRHDEEFEFLPHLTLAYPSDAKAAAEMIVSLERSWEQIRHLQPFTVDRAVFLSRTADGDWNQSGEHNLTDLMP